MQNELIEPTRSQRELALEALRIAIGDPLPAMLPIETVARQMGIEVATARNWIYRKKFPMHSQRVGGLIRVPLLELVRWLALQYPLGDRAASGFSSTLVPVTEGRRGPGRPRGRRGLQ